VVNAEELAFYGEVNPYAGQRYITPERVYVSDSLIEINENMLLDLGFSLDEINLLKFIIENEGKFSRNLLMKYDVPYELINRLKYMYDILIGRVSIESVEDLVKHLKKMFGTHRKIGITDLALSKINKVPRKAVIGNIKDKAFKIYNSKQYKPDKRIYDVEKVTNERIHIVTSRRPVLEYGHPKKIEGVIEILSEKPDKRLVIAVNKKYARLCNRFIIAASLRRPEFHHGLIEIICIEGTRIYVFAQSIGTAETVRYSHLQRVYDYGIFPNTIQPKLINTASELYDIITGVYAIQYPANIDYFIIDPENTETEVEGL